jgi:tetratricopeptide (TPR) repeat protein
VTSDAPPPPRWPVFAFPAAVSLALSACTVGTHAYWQDSPIYLTAVKEFTILYPHGFMPYLALCKAWTLALGFLDFTLAVHLFSSACAALAAGTLALAAERLTLDRAASAVAGALAAAGYTWWFSGIYAKGYALYFLVVSLLLWRMACRDRYSVAPLLGAAWAAHPSAVLLGPAVLAYLGVRRRELRPGPLILSLAGGAIAAVGPSLFLPLLAAQESPLALGHPRSWAELLRYLTGSRFTHLPGVWGIDAVRCARMGQFAGEEFLLVGGVLVVIGLRRAIRDRRRDALFLPVWLLPLLVVTPLFKIEGQYDLWLVAAWMPLWLVAAFGLSALHPRGPWIPGAVGAAGLLCAVGVNGRDLYLRHDTLPEAMGRSFLERLDPGSVLVLNSDDAMGLCRYLQSVRGLRRDVRVLAAPFVRPSSDYAWYLQAVTRAWPDLPRPDFDVVAIHARRYTDIALVQAAIVNGQRPGGPSIYFDSQPPTPLLAGGSVMPAGFLWKWSADPAARPDPNAWRFPVTLEEAAARSSRRRGQHLAFLPDDVVVQPQSYERRLVIYLALARRALAEAAQREGGAAGFARSAAIYESILKAAPEFREDPDVLYPLGLAYYMVDRYPEADGTFQGVLVAQPSPSQKAGALFYLGELRRMQRRAQEATAFYRQALEAVPDGSPLQSELLKRLAPR